MSLNCTNDWVSPDYLNMLESWWHEDDTTLDYLPALSHLPISLRQAKETAREGEAGEALATMDDYSVHAKERVRQSEGETV